MLSYDMIVSDESESLLSHIDGGTMKGKEIEAQDSNRSVDQDPNRDLNRKAQHLLPMEKTHHRNHSRKSLRRNSNHAHRVKEDLQKHLQLNKP
jgi:hypothetical protein